VPTTPVGPVGTVFRPPPRLGSGAMRSGLKLALVVGDNPLAALGTVWGGWRCVTLVCAGFPVR
jgi:hypothetical protein